MLRVGFEPTIPVFERAKTVLALDVIGAVHAIHCELLIPSLGKLQIIAVTTVILSKRYE
jgi:hypothetical protein